MFDFGKIRNRTFILVCPVEMASVAEQGDPKISVNSFVPVSHVCLVVRMAVGAGKFKEIGCQMTVCAAKYCMRSGINREIVIEDGLGPGYMGRKVAEHAIRGKAGVSMIGITCRLVVRSMASIAICRQFGS